MTHFKRTDSRDADFINLVALLDQDLAIRDGAEHGFYAQFNKVGSIRNVVVCYAGDQPVACGAFKPYDEKKVEIKRMYVSPALRGQGIGGAVLRELEQWAAELNYKACVLETGKKQPEAIRLYQKSGYSLIKNYGQYENVENSVCMEKKLF